MITDQNFKNALEMHQKCKNISLIFLKLKTIVNKLYDYKALRHNVKTINKDAYNLQNKNYCVNLEIQTLCLQA